MFVYTFIVLSCSLARAFASCTKLYKCTQIFMCAFSLYLAYLSMCSYQWWSNIVWYSVACLSRIFLLILLFDQQNQISYILQGKHIHTNTQFTEKGKKSYADFGHDVHMSLLATLFPKYSHIYTYHTITLKARDTYRYCRGQVIQELRG